MGAGHELGAEDLVLLENVNFFMAGMYCLADLLSLAVNESAEELRLEPGKPPLIVVRGEFRALDLPALTTDNVADLFSSFATPEQTEELRRCGDIHFTYTSQRSGRFGVKATSERAGITLKMKPI
jgi:Tfp pilus assembly pilus retraction ATPase PilT